MNIPSFSCALVALSCMTAQAADDSDLTRLTTCQESWIDWSKSDPARLQKMGEYFRGRFSHHDNDPFSVPKAETSVLGLRIVQAFPDSVGMGVGFSLLVDAPLDTARKRMEAVLRKKVEHCEASDGMHSCDLPIAEKRTVVLMSVDTEKNKTLIGCYYYYEK